MKGFKMITLVGIISTWYLTKLYYTKSFSVKTEHIENGLVRVTCIKCSRVLIISENNMRTPFYCTMCH
ncbi:MAG: hypothetical protein EB127_15205 [Alphaproteobacteria bacterium]|nr:hypothetical protein [Alphaproteobacteria bacterium]